jgi:hypothetical protein
MQALGVHGQKPDFLVHVPGDLQGNHAIIEVKPAPSRPDKIRKDLQTLSIFMRAGYDRAIYLFYGASADARLIARVARAALQVDGTAGIEVWFQTGVGDRATRVATLE